MLIDWIDAPRLRDIAHDEADYVAHGRRIVARIGEIRGRLPVYQDIGSQRAWSALSADTFDNLRALLAKGWFSQISPEQVERVQAWAANPAVVAQVTAGARVAHGDLMAEQVFVTADGYRVVDWQRPVLAPPDVDLVTLLVGLGIDPRPHVSAAIVRAFWYLRLHWAVEAQAHLFPASRAPVLEGWSAEAIGHILA